MRFPASGSGAVRHRLHATGGSLNFGPDKPGHGSTWPVERFLRRGKGVFTFESQFAADRFRSMVGERRAWSGSSATARTGGVRAGRAGPGAADLVFLGEFREAKGLGVLLDALDVLRRRQGYETSAVLVGGGAEQPAVEARIAALGLRSVSLHGPMNARDALALGRVFVLPSLFESLPYVLIEAAAGGLDIVRDTRRRNCRGDGPAADRLVPRVTPTRWPAVIAATIEDGSARAAARRDAVRDHVRAHLSVETMARGVEAAYRAALADRG